MEYTNEIHQLNAVTDYATLQSIVQHNNDASPLISTSSSSINDKDKSPNKNASSSVVSSTNANSFQSFSLFDLLNQQSALSSTSSSHQQQLYPQDIISIPKPQLNSNTEQFSISNDGLDEEEQQYWDKVLYTCQQVTISASSGETNHENKNYMTDFLMDNFETTQRDIEDILSLLYEGLILSQTGVINGCDNGIDNHIQRNNHRNRTSTSSITNLTKTKYDNTNSFDGDNNADISAWKGEKSSSFLQLHVDWFKQCQNERNKIRDGKNKNVEAEIELDHFSDGLMKNLLRKLSSQTIESSLQPSQLQNTASSEIMKAVYDTVSISPTFARKEALIDLFLASIYGSNNYSSTSQGISNNSTLTKERIDDLSQPWVQWSLLDPNASIISSIDISPQKWNHILDKYDGRIMWNVLYWLLIDHSQRQQELQQRQQKQLSIEQRLNVISSTGLHALLVLQTLLYNCGLIKICHWIGYHLQKQNNTSPKMEGQPYTPSMLDIQTILLPYQFTLCDIISITSCDSKILFDNDSNLTNALLIHTQEVVLICEEALSFILSSCTNTSNWEQLMLDFVWQMFYTLPGCPQLHDLGIHDNSLDVLATKASLQSMDTATDNKSIFAKILYGPLSRIFQGVLSGAQWSMVRNHQNHIDQHQIDSLTKSSETVASPTMANVQEIYHRMSEKHPDTSSSSTRPDKTWKLLIIVIKFMFIDGRELHEDAMLWNDNIMKLLQGILSSSIATSMFGRKDLTSMLKLYFHHLSIDEDNSLFTIQDLSSTITSLSYTFEGWETLKDLDMLSELTTHVVNSLSINGNAMSEPPQVMHFLLTHLCTTRDGFLKVLHSKESTEAFKTFFHSLHRNKTNTEQVNAPPRNFDADFAIISSIMSSPWYHIALQSNLSIGVDLWNQFLWSLSPRKKANGTEDGNAMSMILYVRLLDGTMKNLDFRITLIRDHDDTQSCIERFLKTVIGLLPGNQTTSQQKYMAKTSQQLLQQLRGDLDNNTQDITDCHQMDSSITNGAEPVKSVDESFWKSCRDISNGPYTVSTVVRKFAWMVTAPESNADKLKTLPEDSIMAPKDSFEYAAIEKINQCFSFYHLPQLSGDDTCVLKQLFFQEERQTSRINWHAVCILALCQGNLLQLDKAMTTQRSEEVSTSNLNTIVPSSIVREVYRIVEKESPYLYQALNSISYIITLSIENWIRQWFVGYLSFADAIVTNAMIYTFGYKYAVFVSVAIIRYSEKDLFRLSNKMCDGILDTGKGESYEDYFSLSNFHVAHNLEYITELSEKYQTLFNSS